MVYYPWCDNGCQTWFVQNNLHLDSTVFLLCCSVANDDQYATNVPDTRDEGTSVSTSTEGKGQQGSGTMEVDGEGVKEVEVCYLSQLRRSQYPINGIYKLNHNSAHNHFRKYSDVKHRGRRGRGYDGCALLEVLSLNLHKSTR